MSLRRWSALCSCVGGALLAAGLAAAAPAAPTPKNLLVNPGFETTAPGHPWMPAGWDTAQSGLPSVFFGRDTLSPHGGLYSISVANVSAMIPMSHNWSQGVLVGPEAWNKDVVFSVWTRSNGLEGRAYVLLQAYRDTISKMARVWGVEREAAASRLNINPIDDPLVPLGWKRQFFSENETGWVRREVRVYVPPSVNLLFVRCGLIGTGQVMFDDASLTLEPAAAAAPLPPNTNLLPDPGFEGNGDLWEYSLPPYEGLHVERDSTVAHSGKASLWLEGHNGMISSRAGACQVFCNRTLSGKRVRASAYLKTDSLKSTAFLKIYCHGLYGVKAFPSDPTYSGNTPWTQSALEVDVPEDTYSIWVWFLYNTPGEGRVHFDDTSFEVLGPVTNPEPKAKAPPKR